MAKFVYIGDPSESAKEKARTPEISFSDPVTRKVITFALNGPAVDAPDWLALRLKNSTHFKAKE